MDICRMVPRHDKDDDDDDYENVQSERKCTHMEDTFPDHTKRMGVLLLGLCLCLRRFEIIYNFMFADL